MYGMLVHTTLDFDEFHSNGHFGDELWVEDSIFMLHIETLINYSQN